MMKIMKVSEQRAISSPFVHKNVIQLEELLPVFEESSLQIDSVSHDITWKFSFVQVALLITNPLKTLISPSCTGTD